MPEATLSEQARLDIEEAHDWWAENRSIEQASRWYQALLERILTLEEDPERFGLAPEDALFPYEIRQLLFGLGPTPTHRVVYTICPDQILVLRVRHVAQGPLGGDGI
jgi:plasmid stabilization system protein ParE